MVCYLDAKQKLFVSHLHPFEVVLYLSGPLHVFLHAFDVLHRRPENGAFVPAYITVHTVKCKSNFHR